MYPTLRSAIIITMVLGSAVTAGGCEEGDPSQQCGSRGFWEYRADTADCELTWLCNDDVERQQVCEGSEGGELQCSCYEDGVLVDSFASMAACGARASETKVACGW